MGNRNCGVGDCITLVENKYFEKATNYIFSHYVFQLFNVVN